MRAISLHQPWASAVALGSKRIETRHWATPYRGPLAIHAAKRRMIGELLHAQSCYTWKGALAAGNFIGRDRNLPETLPFGAIVAVCDLVDCRPTESFTVGELYHENVSAGDHDERLYKWTEADMGNFASGRFGWVLANIRALPEPVPCVGGQSFFQWEGPA